MAPLSGPGFSHITAVSGAFVCPPHSLEEMFGGISMRYSFDPPRSQDASGK